MDIVSAILSPMLVYFNHGNDHPPEGQFPGGGGGYCHVWAIYVGAAVKGRVFKPFTRG